MTLRHIICCGLTAMLAVMTLHSLASPTISSVTAHQRYPWNGLVDIDVTIQGSADDAAAAQFLFVATNGTTRMAIPIAHISCNGTAVGSGSAWTRKFIWDAKADVGAVKIDDVTLSVDASFGIQLWENGPYWAECNVGATKPEECGYYFWWGDTVGYKRVGDRWDAVDGSRTGFAFSSDVCPTYHGQGPEYSSYVDWKGELLRARDAASVHLGTPWCTPTRVQLKELLANCTTTWTIRNGMSGRLITGKGAYSSRSIFLPAAGRGDGTSIEQHNAKCFYWSTSQSGDSADNSYYF